MSQWEANFVQGVTSVSLTEDSDACLLLSAILNSSGRVNTLLHPRKHCRHFGSLNFCFTKRVILITSALKQVSEAKSCSWPWSKMSWMLLFHLYSHLGRCILISSNWNICNGPASLIPEHLLNSDSNLKPF